jgi:hypothetical protein
MQKGHFYPRVGFRLGASSAPTYLRVGMNWDILKQ